MTLQRTIALAIATRRMGELAAETLFNPPSTATPSNIADWAKARDDYLADAAEALRIIETQTGE